MKRLHTSTLLTLVLALGGLLIASGCNTMKGLGKDTERVGEKIQDKASR